VLFVVVCCVLFVVLLFVVCCVACCLLLFVVVVVCCCLFVVCCCLLLCVVCCLLFVVVCCLLFVVVVCCLLFVVGCLLFIVCCLLFVVCCLLFVVCCCLRPDWMRARLTKAQHAAHSKAPASATGHRPCPGKAQGRTSSHEQNQGRRYPQQFTTEPSEAAKTELQETHLAGHGRRPSFSHLVHKAACWRSQHQDAYSRAHATTADGLITTFKVAHRQAQHQLLTPGTAQQASKPAQVQCSAAQSS